jgi:UDP:flavonoid glycosyltransferase YjiC (YdhE family)
MPQTMTSFKASLLLWALLLLVYLALDCSAAELHTNTSTLPENYFLLTSAPFSGHANNIFQLGSGLRHRGYRVVVAMNDDDQNLKKRALAADLDYFDLGDKPYSRQIIDGVNAGSGDGLNPFRSLKFVANSMPEFAFGYYLDLETIIKEKLPRAFVFEDFNIYAGHLAHKYSIPGVLIAPLAELDLCPMTAPIVIGNLDPNFPERVASLLLRVVLDRWAAFWFHQSTSAHCQKIDIPSELCFPPRHHVAKYGLLAILPTGYPISVCDLPAHYKRVGPFLTPSTARGFDQESWFQERKAEDSHVIYISTGSDTVPEQWQLEALLEGIDMVRQGYDNPLHVYYARGQAFLDRYPSFKAENHPNVYWAKYSPQHWILNHTCTKVFISHCGSGGAHEACYFGVPVYAMPFGRDQFAISAALTASGMAITASTYNLKAKQVEKDIRKLLLDGRYTKTARKIARIGQNLGGVLEAIDLIERYLAIGSNDYLVPYNYAWPLWKKLSLDIGLFLAMMLLGLPCWLWRRSRRNAVESKVKIS